MLSRSAKVGIAQVFFYDLIHLSKQCVVHRRLGQLWHRFGGRGGKALHQPAPHGDHVADARFDPVVVKAVETIGKAVPLRCAVAQCREGQREHVVFIA